MRQPRPQLDAIDRVILGHLQAEGRITNLELAGRAGITPPPCLRRVQKLEEAGVIRGYYANLNPDLLGYGITVFAMVRLTVGTIAVFEAFEAHAAAQPEVRECHLLSGDIDFLLKVVAHDLKHFQNFLTTVLTPAPNVASVKTSLTIRASKKLLGVPTDV